MESSGLRSGPANVVAGPQSYLRRVVRKFYCCIGCSSLLAVFQYHPWPRRTSLGGLHVFDHPLSLRYLPAHLIQAHRHGTTLAGLRFSADRSGNVPDRSDPARGAVDELSVHEHLEVLQGHHLLSALAVRPERTFLLVCR